MPVSASDPSLKELSGAGFSVAVPPTSYEKGLMREPVGSLGHTRERSVGTLGCQMGSGCA